MDGLDGAVMSEEVKLFYVTCTDMFVQWLESASLNIYVSVGIQRPLLQGCEDIGSMPAARGILLLTMRFDLVMPKESERFCATDDEGIKEAGINWQLQGLD